MPESAAKRTKAESVAETASAAQKFSSLAASNVDQLNSCFAEPVTAGMDEEFQTSIKVRSSGTVSVGLAQKTRTQEQIKCVKDKIASWKFPAPPSGKIFSASLDLNRVGMFFFLIQIKVKEQPDPKAAL